MPLRARDRERKARIVGEPRLPHGDGQPPEHRLAHRRDVDELAVLRRVEVVRRAFGQARTRARRDMPQLLVGRDPRLHEAESAFVQRRIDVLPSAGFFTREQRKGRTERAVEPGDVVGHRHRHPRGRAVRVAGQVAQSAYRLADHAVASTLAVRSVLAEAADPHHHETRIDRGELRIPQPPFFQPAGAEVLHHDVAFGREFGNDLLPFGAAQVDADQRLVAEDARRVERLAVETLAHRAHRIAVGRFDLDDLRAEVRQQAAAERAGDGGPHLEHAISRQRPRRCGRLRGDGGLRGIHVRARISGNQSDRPWRYACSRVAAFRRQQHRRGASLPALQRARANPAAPGREE